MDQPPEGPSAADLGAQGRSLLERDRELTTLRRTIEQSVAGTASVCVVEGPAGIGKTRLVGQARRFGAESEMTVLSATASEFERRFPFGIVGQLFESAVQEGGEQRLLGGGAAPAALIVGSQRLSAPAQTGDPSFAALNGLYRLTVRLAEEHPLLLAIDDLQWCDAPSLRFLAYLRSRFEGLPVLIVCSARPTDPGPESAALDALIGDPATSLMHPRPISVQATGVLVERRLGAAPEEAFTGACHRATGGNPLLLDELLKALAAEDCRPDSAGLAMLDELGPTSVTRTVFLRLRRLGADAVAIARAIGVLGDGANLTTVAGLAGLHIDRAGAAISALARAEIVKSEPPLGFVHPLVASAIYRDVLPGERNLLHLRAAEFLMAGHASTERVAGHLLQAPTNGEPWVAEQLMLAAGAASAKGAADSAVAYLDRALIEPVSPRQHVDLLLALGRAHSTRNGGQAAGALGEVYPMLGDPVERAEVAGLLGRMLLFTGAGSRAVQLVREAAAALPAGEEGLCQQLQAFELFSTMLFGVGDTAAIGRLSAYRTRPVGTTVGSRMLAAVAAHAWMYAGGPATEVSALSVAALADGGLLTTDLGWAVTFALTNLSYADHPDADGWWERASALAHRRGSLLEISGLTLWRGNDFRRRGELDDAEHSLRICMDVTRQWGYTANVQSFCDAEIAAVHRERGDLAGARRALGATPDPGRNDEGARLWFGSHLELLLAESSFEAAVAGAGDYADRFAATVPNPMDVPWRSVQALALHRLGRRDRALELATEELEIARAWGGPSTVAVSLRALGTIEPDGLRSLEESVAQAANSPSRLQHAKSLAAFGTALRRSRRPTQARAPLRQALDQATTCGAAGLADVARSELYAAGGRPRRTALSGVAALTAGEHRVVAFAADGLTNREIGETVYITPKTVAMHLSNAYRKLGVSSRRELSDVLGDSLTGRTHNWEIRSP